MQRLSLPSATAGGRVVVGLLLVVIALIGATTAISPIICLVLAVGVAGVLLAISLFVKLHLSPMWLVLPVAFIQPLNGIRISTSITIGDLGLVAVGLGMIPFVGRAPVNRRLLLPFMGLLLVIAGGLFGGMAIQGTKDTALLNGLTTLSSVNSSSNLLGAGGEGSSLIRFVVGAPMLLALIALLNPSPKFASAFARAYALGTVVSALVSLTGYNVNPYYERAVGLAAHELHFGLTCVFAAAVFIGWAVSTRRTSIRVFAILCFLLCSYGVILSGARSAFIGLSLVLLYFAFLGRSRGIAWMISIGVVGTGGLWLLTPLTPQGSTLYRLFGAGGKSSLVSQSNDQHVEALNTAINQIGLHPWTGTGFAAGLAAHNLELEAADIGGITAFAGIVLVWATIFTLLWRQMRFGVHPSDWVHAAPLVGLLGYFGLAQFENIFWDRHLWFFIASALIAAPRIGRHGEADDPSLADDPPGTDRPTTLVTA